MILAIQKDVVIIFEFQGFLLEHIISKKFDKIKAFKMTIFYALNKTTLRTAKCTEVALAAKILLNPPV